MKIITPFLFIAFLGIVSCKQDMKPTYLQDDDSSKDTLSKNSTNNQSNLVNPNLNPTVAPNSTTTPVVATSTNAGVMNPEHGKPGHRCDIPVGAPLNPKPNANAEQKPQQVVIDPSNFKQNVATTINKSAPKTAPGMNPPHGEPGHRCDIAVGAPLNSPPGKNAVQNVAQNSPAPVSKSQSNKLPATIAAPTSEQTPAVGADGKPLTVNPAHGEPGHRCDIAVGAPLK